MTVNVHACFKYESRTTVNENLMPIMLNFKFTESSPKGDLIKICLIGDGSVILPHLESDVAAHLIEVMTAAQFKGEKIKY